MDDFSIESLYEMGLGFKAVNNSSKVSIEDWDGDSDALAYEMASAESMVETMDIFSRMTHLNSVQQIKCAHRISANYGNCNRGIESYCRNIIQSAEANDAAAGNDTDPKKEETEGKDGKKDEKKVAWYKKMFGAIATFFKKIWEFIKSIPVRIKAFFKHWKEHGFKGSGKAAGEAGKAQYDKNMAEYYKKHPDRKPKDKDESSGSSSSTSSGSSPAVEKTLSLIESITDSIQQCINKLDPSQKKLQQLLKDFNKDGELDQLTAIMDRGGTNPNVVSGSRIGAFSKIAKLIIEFHNLFIKGYNIFNGNIKKFSDDDFSKQFGKVDKSSFTKYGNMLNAISTNAIALGQFLKEKGIADPEFDDKHRALYNTTSKDVVNLMKYVNNGNEISAALEQYNLNTTATMAEFCDKSIGILKKIESNEKSMSDFVAKMFGINPIKNVTHSQSLADQQDNSDW